MAIGKELGKFSCKSTSLTYGPGEGGVENVDVNYEGTIEGGGANGAVLGTMNIVPAPDAQSGTWTWVGREFAADGATRLATGAGFFRTSGANSWDLRGYIYFADGSCAATEAALDLASRTMKGKLSEWD